MYKKWTKLQANYTNIILRTTYTDYIKYSEYVLKVGIVIYNPSTTKGFEIDTEFRGHLSTMGITRMPCYMLN